MTIGQTLKKAEEGLQRAEISTAMLDAQVLLEFVTNQNRSHLLAHPGEEISASQLQKFNKLIAKRAEHVPIAHLTGQKEFYGLNFKVSDQVLSPRPESEKIVELAIKFAPEGGHLLDIGTGSGALAIAIMKSRTDLITTGTDVSTEAVAIARQNAKNHQVKIKFQISDLFDQVSGRFDTIVANLPYVPSLDDLNADAKHEPKVALLGGKQGLDLYKCFFAQVPSHLQPRGYVIIESDPWQQSDLNDLAKKAGLTLIKQGYFISCFQLG